MKELEPFVEIEIGEHVGPELRLILEVLARVRVEIRQLREELHEMSTTAVTRDQLDAAIATLLTAEAARDAAVTKALNDLEAKIAAGTVTTPADFSAELANIKTLQANAAALTQTATADDPGPTTVTTTPPPTTTPPATGSTNPPAGGSTPAA